MIDGLSIVVDNLNRCILPSLLVDKTLLSKYVKLFPNFRGRPFRVEMAPSR